MHISFLHRAGWVVTTAGLVLVLDWKGCADLEPTKRKSSQPHQIGSGNKPELFKPLNAETRNCKNEKTK